MLTIPARSDHSFDIDQLNDSFAGDFLLLVLGLGQLTTNHHVRQLLTVSLAAIDGGDDLTCPQNGNAIGDVQHFTHLVADEDDGLTFASQLVHNGEQTLDLDIGQSSGGFVQNQQLCTVVQCLKDLNALLGADRDLSDLGIQLNVETVALGQLQDLLAPCGTINENTLGVLIAQNDVVKNRLSFDQHKVLMHHADARLYAMENGIFNHGLDGQGGDLEIYVRNIEEDFQPVPSWASLISA